MAKSKKMIIAVLTLTVLILAGVTGYYRYMQSRYIQTDDARVDGNIINVSPQITSIITSIYVAEGDQVSDGDIIARQSDTTLPQGSNMDLAIIKSPASGAIIKKMGNVGEIGSPGKPVVMLCDLARLYIIANIVETDLHKVQVGQKVDITIDAFPNLLFSGYVVSIGDASLSTFSLLSPQNTGGNYTKVAQRIPVKISINDYQGCRLRPGMNVFVKIHISG